MFLGIDSGTTKIACVVMQNNRQVATSARNHKAYVVFNDNFAEQNAELLVKETMLCQMHGLLLIDNNNRAVSPQYTWQDMMPKNMLANKNM